MIYTLSAETETDIALDVKGGLWFGIKGLISGWFGQGQGSVVASQMCKWVIQYVNMIGDGDTRRVAHSDFLGATLL